MCNVVLLLTNYNTVKHMIFTQYFTDLQQVPRMVAPGTFVRGQFPHPSPRPINPEMSRQLRDLLQRQQLKTKLETDRPWSQGKRQHIPIKLNLFVIIL